ncbi:MAG: TldD/PmbA family protein [Spirochaetes bacterium]|nr:TldD/PmbA family protein [Spirochaetota bacterium]
MIYRNIERHASRFKDYTELRIHENRSLGIQILNGDVLSNNRESGAGVSARVYRGGVWGFASAPFLDDAAIGRVIETATQNAQFLSSREKRGMGPLPMAKASAAHDLSSPKPRGNQEKYLGFARALDAYLKEKHPELLSRSIYLGTLEVEKHLLTSEGSVSTLLVPRTVLYLSASREAKNASKDRVEQGHVFGGGGHFEEHFGDPAALFPGIEAVCEDLARKAEGDHAEAGEHEVVLGPDLAGILAHEAIGHTVEADLVLGGSVAGDFLGKPVATELVSITDFAHTALGAPCPQPLWVDDEGTPARDTVLIENGVLKNFMHNKETARHFGHEATGHARAWSFSDEPLIRMRNTAILPGKSRLADMIASIDKGYYLEQPSNGQADSTSEFMFGVTRGREIRGGKLGRALFDATVSGVAFDMLKTVTMVSDDMRWESGGMCGKKQPIPVGMGGPALKCRIRIGGR